MKEVVLLADPKSNAWDFSKKIQDYIHQEKKCKVPLEEIQITNFRNGEFLPHVPGNIRKKDVYFIHDSSEDPASWWAELLLMKDLLQNSSANDITFVLPNFLWARQDRKNEPHVPISVRAVATSLSYPFPINRVITMDLHADQIQEAFPSILPIDSLHSFREVIRYLEKHPIQGLENLAVFSPDAGGVNRAKAFHSRLKTTGPVGFLYKERGEPGEIKEMRYVGDVEGYDILLIDDIIDSGKSLCKAAKLLKENKAKKLFCYGTHAFFTKGTKELLENFDKVMISNTHYFKRDGIEVIDVSPVFAEAIYRAQKGESISELFE